MLTRQQRSNNQNLLIASNSGILILVSAWGNADASLFQLYSTNILHLNEKEIGFAIGLLSLSIPIQFIGIILVKRFGAKLISMIDFALLFFLLPVMLIIPMIQAQNEIFGYILFCTIILLMNAIHTTVSGTAWQPLIRDSTEPHERGIFFAKMRLSFHSVLLIFFGIFSVTIGKQMSLENYAFGVFYEKTHLKVKKAIKFLV